MVHQRLVVQVHRQRNLLLVRDLPPQLSQNCHGCSWLFILLFRCLRTVDFVCFYGKFSAQLFDGTEIQTIVFR